MFSLCWFTLLSDWPGFLLLIWEPNCSSPNILPCNQSHMTASLPGIGTLSIFPSVPKKQKKENMIHTKKTIQIFVLYYWSVCVIYFKYQNSPHKFSLLGINCGFSTSPRTRSRQTVSKYAHKLCICFRINTLLSPTFDSRNKSKTLLLKLIH